MPVALLVAADVDPSFRERIAADSRFTVTFHDCRDEASLVAAVSSCEVLVTRAYNSVSARVIAAAPALRLIAQGTSGTDNIDLVAAATRNIDVISLPGENANAVAELVVGHMIAMTRTVPTYSAGMRRGAWSRDDCSTRHELRHHPVGIVGLGRVGSLVAKYARSFGMQVSAYDPYLSNSDFGERGAMRVATLDELLRRVSILTLHVPLTPETRGMIGSAQLAMLTEGTFVINACRGEVLDIHAALTQLKMGHLGGLAIDVYDPEPPRISWPDDPRLILTPHIAGCTHEAKNAIGEKLYERVVAWADARRVPSS